MVTREEEIFLERGRNSQLRLELNLKITIIVWSQAYGKMNERIFTRIYNSEILIL